MDSSDRPNSRRATQIDAIANAHLETMADLDPVFATEIGVGGREDRLTDYSPAGCETRTQAARNTLSALVAAPVVDDIDRISVATMSAQLSRSIAVDEAGYGSAN